MKRVIAAFVIVYTSLASYANIKVINPVPGEWANRQVLAIDKAGCEDVFYSLDGSDPMVSGFAYDEPALLDKGGAITLRVTSVTKDGKREEYTINYAVKEQSSNESFLNDASRTGFVDYKAGETLSLPRTVRYSIDGGAFEEGRDLCCTADNILPRTAQAVIVDNQGRRYSLVLRVLPDDRDADQESAVPFSITGWYALRLNNTKCIYSIDGGMWRPCTGAGDDIILDRRRRHTISWQSVSYKRENPIATFVLPPIPYLDTAIGGAGEVSINIQGDEGYKIGVVSLGKLHLMDNAVLDVIYGDRDEGAFPARMYYKGVYQGAIALPYCINRGRPRTPVLESSALSNSVTRDDVDVRIMAREGATLYVAVDGGEYKAITGNGDVSYNVYLTADSTSGMLAKHSVAAYCVDGKGKVSDTIVYSVTIDKYNYFVDEVHGKRGATGDFSAPYSTLEECMAKVKSGARITVRGTVHTKGTVIKDCAVAGEGADARVIVEGGGTLLVQGKVSIQDVIVEREGEADNIALIDAKDAELTIEGAEIFAVYGKSGAVVNAEGGVLNIQDSGVSGKASLFVTAIATYNTDVNIQDSRMSSTAMEAVTLTSQGGTASINGCTLRVNAKRAHALELFDAFARITNNTMEATLSDGGDKAIYTQNSTVEAADNTERGW